MNELDLVDYTDLVDGRAEGTRFVHVTMDLSPTEVDIVNRELERRGSLARVMRAVVAEFR